MCDDPNFTNLTDTTIIQSGSGHAFEITSTGTYTLTDLTYSGFGGTAGSNLTANSGANDAVFFNDSGGAVTLNITGGGTPSVRNGAGATTTVNNSVNVTFEAVDVSDDPIQNVRVSAYLVSDDSEIINALTNASGIASTSFSGSTPADFYYKFRKSSSGATKYTTVSGPGTIESGSGASVKRALVVDDISDPAV